MEHSMPAFPINPTNYDDFHMLSNLLIIFMINLTFIPEV